MWNGGVDGSEASQTPSQGIVLLRQDILAVALDVPATSLVIVQEVCISAVVDEGADLSSKFRGDGPSSHGRSTQLISRWSRRGYRNCEPRD